MKSLAFVCGWLPRPVMLTVLHIIALLLYGLAGKRMRRRITDNMIDLLPEAQHRLVPQYTRSFFANLVVSLYEIMVDSYRLEQTSSGRFLVEGERHLQEALQLGRGAIVFTPHAGNFFYYYWYLTRKYSCLTVATGGSAELRPLYYRFRDMGCPGLDYDSVPPLELLRKLKNQLEAGGIVFLLGDFWRPSFPPATFFGRSTRSPLGAALLSIERMAPVIPFYGCRERGFTHRLTFEQPQHFYERFGRSGREEATGELNRFMERVICRHPEQWFYWFNAEERWESPSVKSHSTPSSTLTG